MQTLTLPQQIARMDGERQRRYRANMAFYQGQQWEGTPRKRERRLTFNYVRSFADKVTSNLMMGRDFAVDPSPQFLSEGASVDARAHAARTETFLRRVWEENNLDLLDFDTELDAAVLGDAAYKVTWDAGWARQGGVGVRVSAPDVQGLFVWCHGDDLTRLWRVASRYQLTPDEVADVFGVMPRRTAAGGMCTVVEAWTDAELTVWVDDDPIAQRANPYGFIPYVIYPNLREPKSFWGVSDLEPLVEPARELNRAMSQLSMILELSGNPVAVLENVTGTEDIAVTPGAVWELPEKAKAYLLDLLQGGGVRLHTDYIDLIYRTLHDLSETPRTAFGENRQALSGVALNTELDPLLKKVHRKRQIRSAAYRRRNELILRLAEQFTGEPFAPYRTRMVWGPVLPQDRSRQVEDERVLVEAGIHSRRRAADLLGVEDPDAELIRWIEERQAMTVPALEPARAG